MRPGLGRTLLKIANCHLQGIFDRYPRHACDDPAAHHVLCHLLPRRGTACRSPCCASASTPARTSLRSSAAGIMAVDERAERGGPHRSALTLRRPCCYIIIPQALKNVLPALANEFIVLLKETSVACYVAVNDLTKRRRDHPRRRPTSSCCRCWLVAIIVPACMVVFFSHGW